MVTVFFVLITFFGFYLAETIRDDSLQPVFLVLALFGVFGSISYVLLPLALKKSAKNFSLCVYENHIEGKCAKTTGLQTSIQEIYEQNNNICSVSTADNRVIINLKDGGSLSCPAGNALEIAKIIRSLVYAN